MLKHPLHRIALMQCHSCLVPFGLTPFGPREPRSGRRRSPCGCPQGKRQGGDTCPEPHTCTCSALQVRCRWERGTAPLPPFAQHPFGAPLVTIPHAFPRKRRGG